MAAAGPAWAQDCQLKQYDSISMNIVKDHILIPIKLNGVQQEFALTISNALNGISQAKADELGLSLKSIDANTKVVRGGARITRMTRADEFQMGRISLKNVTFLVLPPEANKESFDGDIGMRLFSKADIELDMAGRKFNLFSTDHCPTKVVYWTKTGAAQIPFVFQETGYVRPVMQLDGHPVRVALEPNARSQIGMNTMRRIFGVDALTGLVPLGQNGDGRKTFRFAFKSLTVDGLTISNPDIEVVDEDRDDKDCSGRMALQFPNPPPLHSTEQPQLATCSGGGDVSLGYSVLSKLRMYFALKEKMLYVTAAGAN